METEGGEQEVKIEDKEEDSQPEAHDDEDHPSSTAAHPEQEDEEIHPPVPAEDENCLQTSSEQHKTLESLEGPVASTQLEEKEPVTDDGEIQVKEEEGEARTQPEEQELEATDIKQEATEE